MQNDDSALALRKRLDHGESVDAPQVQRSLAESPLMTRLLAPFKARLDLFTGVRALEWRLLELCEIPFAETLPQVQMWLDRLLEKTVIPQGFSLEGTADGVTACHMAMLTRIVMCLRPGDHGLIQPGIQWILDHQCLDHGETCTWQGKDLYTRWGGCMKTTPCYYGVVKALVTLTEYQRRYGVDAAVQEKLDRGLAVLLSHHVFQRRSTGEPIEPSIIQNFYPYPYKTNLIETLGVLKAGGRMADPRCAQAIDILRSKQFPDGTWGAEISFMKSAWVEFDPLKKSGAWITYVIRRLLDDTAV